MKFLILAYGSENDWKALDPDEQRALLEQDDVLRDRGSLVAAVEPTVTTVRGWDGVSRTQVGPVVALPVPLAGFGVIEAEDLAEAVRLVADTPCARAKGAVEIRPILQMNAGAAVVA